MTTTKRTRGQEIADAAPTVLGDHERADFAARIDAAIADAYAKWAESRPITKAIAEEREACKRDIAAARDLVEGEKGDGCATVMEHHALAAIRARGSKP